MKKLVLVVALAAIMSTGAVFAQHPDGWGVGVGFQFGNHWDNDRGSAHSGFTLFLKAPQLPIYWGIYADIFDWEFDRYTYVGFRVTGDYHMRHEMLVPEIGLSWYWGIGGYLGFWHWSYRRWSANLLDFGIRVPIGLSFMPLDFFDVFLAIAPSIGLYLWTGDRDRSGLGGGWQGDIGIRFWF